MTKKVTRISHRGTESHEAVVKPQNWAGDDYRNIEKEKLVKVPKGSILHLGRGIRTTKVEDLPEPKNRLSTEGMTRVTNRGTGSRASKNKGTNK